MAGVAANAAAGAACRVIKTDVEFLAKQTRYSAGNINAGTSTQEAIRALEVNGYMKTFSQDGSIAILTKGAKTYRFYPKSKSTSEPSATITFDGAKKASAKIRFEE
ncbi:hypothetical protein [Chitinimonas arctica]|uniref:hypothetical protein n=1 Tax=Chitinimonas arctica TaxID=2594795 RepID=UPI001CC7C0E5|nr:hypothetical protein [Chitinimonas arctica]